jgi:hypothetical protein
MGLSVPAASLPAQAGNRMEEQMTEITVDLQDGFMDDTVAVSCGGREVVREQGVTTRFQIGMAKSLQVAVPEGAEVLEVEVPTKGERATVPIDPSKPVYVGVSLTTEGQLDVTVQERPFGYM